MRTDEPLSVAAWPSRASGLVLPFLLVAACLSGCASGADFDAVVAQPPSRASEGRLGEWSVGLRSTEGEPFAGSEFVTVHFDEADFVCERADPALLQQGDQVRVEREDNAFMVSDPPQTVAVRVVCDD